LLTLKHKPIFNIKVPTTAALQKGLTEASEQVQEEGGEKLGIDLNNVKH
jgi:hypothetical protein